MTELKAVPLDEHERRALTEFLRMLEEESCEPPLVAEEGRVFRGPDGQIIVPVTLQTAEPSVSLALMMEHKADHLYKQTGCRFVLAQRPAKDPTQRLYVWTGSVWQALA